MTAGERRYEDRRIFEPEAYDDGDQPPGEPPVPDAAGPGAEPDGPRPWSGSLYGWLWRRLPGSRLVRVLTLLAGALAVAAVLVLVVFPFVEPRLPFNQVTVDQPSSGPTGSGPSTGTGG